LHEMTVMFEDATKILFVAILLTAAIVLTKRDILGIISAYSLQSFLISAVAAVMYAADGTGTLLFVSALTLCIKALLVPAIMKGIQKQIKIKRDVEFAYLSPVSALGASMILLLAGYGLLSGLIGNDRALAFGTVAGISLMFMGMLVVFTRKQAITGIVGYLTMENGVVLMSLFLTELPLLIEVLILVDLIGIMLLAAILSFGINSSIEEFHQKLVRPFGGKTVAPEEGSA